MDQNKSIYELFWLSIITKAITSVSEIIAGIALAVIPSTFILHYTLILTRDDIDGDADDFITKDIISLAHTLAISHSFLIGLYLFIRGFIQFLIVIALFRNKIWAYPTFIGVLFVIIATQIFDIYISHSVAAMVLTIIDSITITLVWREYRIVKKAGTRSEPV